MKRLIVGVIFIAAILLAGFQFKNQATYEKMEFQLSEEIHSLTIDDENNNIEIVSTNDDSPYILIYYYENSKHKYDIDQDEGDLSMIKRSERFGFGLSWLPGIDFSDKKVTVEISQKKLKDLSLSTTNGKIVLEDLTFQSGILDTTNGAIKIRNSQIKNDLICSTTNGKITFDDSFIQDGEFDSTNGKIELDDADIGHSLFLDTTNASIKGSIAGSRSDFSIASDTTNGKNSLGNTNPARAKKTLNASTTNGSIDVEFADD